MTPTTDEMRGIFIGHQIQTCIDADAVEASMAFDAWLNNIKANLLREVADLYDTLQTRHNDHYSRRDPALWLHYEADRFEEAPMADEYVPTT